VRRRVKFMDACYTSLIGVGGKKSGALRRQRSEAGWTAGFVCFRRRNAPVNMSLSLINYGRKGSLRPNKLL
jgi:hypothetical protein